MRRDAMLWGLCQLGVCLIVVAILACPAMAIQVQFSQGSDPPAIVPDSTILVNTGAVVTTATAPVTYGTYYFAYWTVNGTRRPDSLGRSLNPVTFTITEPVNVNAIAHYLTDIEDINTNGVADWFEYQFYGDLTNATSNTDADGFTLLQEYNRDTHPNLKDTISDGGISQRASASLLFINATNVVLYQTLSSPPGIIATNLPVYIGSGQILPDLYGVQYGYRFSQWLVNNVCVTDELGRSVGNLSFAITTNTTALAVFYRETDDANTNGVADWFEYQFYGDLTNATSETDGDGFTLLDEYIRDTHPKLKDTISDGGISQRPSVLISILNRAYTTYREISSPLGFINNEIVVPTNSIRYLNDLYGVQAGYRFAQWTAGGVRQADELGRSVGFLPVTIYTNTTAVAEFYRETDDVNANGVADWFEYQFYGGLTNATSDTDGDGFTLFDEYIRDTHPKLKDTISDGGISQRASNLLLLDTREYAFYKITSSPTGFVYETGYVPTGTNITTAAPWGPTNGYAFAYWDVNGVRQQDTNSVTINPITFPLLTNTTATAIYHRQDTDTDSDGLPDWWEDRYFGGPTTAVAGADTDGDGLTNREEYEGGSNPRVPDRLVLSIDWLGGVGNWSNGSKWSTGVVPNDSPPTNFVVYIDHGRGASSIVTQNVSVALERLKIDAADKLYLLPDVALTLYLRPTGGIITNAGLIALNGTDAGSSELRIANGAGTLTGGGTITLTDNTNNLIRTTDASAWFYNINNTILGSGNIGSNSLGIVNSGTIIANQSTPLVLDPADSLGFTNTGAIQVNTGSTLMIQGPGFIQTAGTMLVNGTLVAGSSLNIAGGILTGNGTNVANVSNNGTLVPGAGLGRFTVTGDLTQQSNACLTIEIGGYDAGSNCDLVSVSGTAIFGGRLAVNLTNSFAQVITNGASFTVLTAGAISGAFSNVANGGLLTTGDGNVQFTVQYSGNNLVLRVQSMDTDSDGMPNWWESLYFGDPTNAVAGADSDGDGFSNLQEYLAGTDPKSAFSRLAITNIYHAVEGWEIAFPSISGKVYRVEYTPDLRITNDWPILLDEINSTSSVTRVVDTTVTNQPVRFYRVRLKQ